MGDLEEAITCQRQVLALLPHGHPIRSLYLSNLSNALSTRFQQLGRMEDLEEAITCQRQVHALQSHDYPKRPPPLNNLGSATSTRFEQLRKNGGFGIGDHMLPSRSSTCSPTSWPYQSSKFSL